MHGAFILKQQRLLDISLVLEVRSYLTSAWPSAIFVSGIALIDVSAFRHLASSLRDT